MVFLLERGGYDISSVITINAFWRCVICGVSLTGFVFVMAPGTLGTQLIDVGGASRRSGTSFPAEEQVPSFRTGFPRNFDAKNVFAAPNRRMGGRHRFSTLVLVLSVGVKRDESRRRWITGHSIWSFTTVRCCSVLLTELTSCPLNIVAAVPNG